MNEVPQNTPSHQTQMASLAQEFMTRTDLKGREVDAYAQSFNWLQGLASEEILVISQKHMTAIQEETKNNQELLARYQTAFGGLEDEPPVKVTGEGLEVVDSDTETNE